ncbi:uncharacterized protein LOC143465593 isoform X2 [Clavelina lepadiformis]|uniref:uncharacterized protein LOC143465593 isoform X2 n=1 Tax=Clavelina lepadiformis TaxID=159417 RepID=UPI00404288FE
MIGAKISSMNFFARQAHLMKDNGTRMYSCRPTAESRQSLLTRRQPWTHNLNFEGEVATDSVLNILSLFPSTEKPRYASDFVLVQLQFCVGANPCKYSPV